MCKHNCNQGRNCTCANNEAENSDLVEIGFLGVLFVVGFAVLFGSVIILLGL